MSKVSVLIAIERARIRSVPTEYMRSATEYGTRVRAMRDIKMAFGQDGRPLPFYVLNKLRRVAREARRNGMSVMDAWFFAYTHMWSHSTWFGDYYASNKGNFDE